MSNEKFTQGEWAVSTEDDDCFIVRDKNGGFVCYGGCFNPDNKSEVEAAKKDIHLIAAAPEMYALLSLMTEPTFMGETIPQYLRSAIESVLNKARGEE